MASSPVNRNGKRANSESWRAGLFAVVVTVGLVYWLVVKWGLVGAAYGFLAGNVAGAVGRWAAFSTLVPRYGPKPDSEADPLATGAPI